MSVDGFSENFFKGPAYALVIGISKYKFGKEHGQELSSKEFPNLTVARRDADDFAEFLKHYGFIEYNVRKLVDEEATLPSVKDELEKLRKLCKQSSDNPLVIVYFSGHGAKDEEERHYLIPFEGERDRLPATAFEASNFSKLLDELPTNRLVVFIDSCHAGAMGANFVKGAVQEYDVRIDLGEGQGRYLIASCLPGQKSYELEQNSIFTSHLLELLKCDTDDIDEEEVDVFTLFKKLKEKVRKTAKEKYGEEQEPTTKMTSATGIVLAINQRVRDRRVEADNERREKKIRFFEAISDRIKSSKSLEKTIIFTQLEEYAKHGDNTLGAPDDFYKMFDELFGLWEANGNVPYKCCELLILKHSAPPPKAVRPKESNTQEPPKPVETTAPADNTRLVGTESPQSPPSPVLTSAGPPQLKRRLSPADVEYVLAEIMTFEYYGEFKILSDRLKWPVSEAEILVVVHAMASKAGDALRSILERIITRLRERWPDAEIVESKSLASVMLQKGHDV